MDNSVGVIICMCVWVGDTENDFELNASVCYKYDPSSD